MNIHLVSGAVALLLVASVAYAPIGGPGGVVNTYTTSTSQTQTFHTTNNAVEVNSYQTRLTARIGTGALLYDQTFNAQLSDPIVQSAIQQARTQLTGAGAASISGPSQTGNVRTLTGAVQDTVVNNTQQAFDIATTATIGPANIKIGDLGLCTGLTGVSPTRIPTGCSGGQLFAVLAGTENFDTNTNTQSDIFQTTTTTSTYQVAQTYELIGSTTSTTCGTPTTPTGDCTFAFSRPAVTSSSIGDTQSVTIKASASTCSWNAQSTANWITLGGTGSGTGTAPLRFSIAPNPSALPRTGTITAAGGQITLNVIQAGNGCTYSLSTQSTSAAASGGPFNLQVTTTPNCFWTPTAAPDWITLNSQAQSGAGALNYTLTANSCAARSGSATIAGQVVQVIQGAASPVQGFQDVPLAHPYFNHISLMKDNAITSGCTATTYCPDNTTTRGAMAVFIVRALLGDTFAFPAAAYFTDVPTSHPYFKYIQKMRQLGITSGCTADTYCPDNPVTRGQMAVFIIRARLGIAPGDPLIYPTTQSFTDVPTNHPYYSYIQKMKEQGITTGCTATTYCPDDPNTRGQMAVFLVRGLLTP